MATRFAGSWNSIAKRRWPIRIRARKSRSRAADNRRRSSAPRAIYRIWPDFPIKALLVKSVSTVKADAAHSSFAAFGADIVWAVVDSGVDAKHPHFKLFRNLDLGAKLDHYDFTADQPLEQPASSNAALRDEAGHGTHVAGIIAGCLSGKPKSGVVRAVARRWTENGATEALPETYDAITGMAPRCKIVSMKVLDDEGNGRTSSVIQALERIQEINGYGRRVLIHGVNLSVGYDFEPEWFACGQSPLCVEVDRLVRGGVVVVVAAGNTGYGVQTTETRAGTNRRGFHSASTIREMPSWRSPSAPRIAKCRTRTACRISHQRARRATGG